MHVHTLGFHALLLSCSQPGVAALPRPHLLLELACTRLRGMCTACAERMRVRQVGVSLVLSFMVVWDLPTIARGVRSLQTSRLGPIYNEVAPSVAVFSQLFGKALQAQVPPSLPRHHVQGSRRAGSSPFALHGMHVCHGGSQPTHHAL